jgi:acetyl esterase/lipase
MMARDRGVHVAYQFPLYPMLNNMDTESSRDNYGRIWNTRRNHLGWRLYLRDDAKKETVSPYASPSRQTDYSGLPPCYTFVGEGEPFYAETLQYVEDLRRAGVPAEVDVYPTNVHAFDMLYPEEAVSLQAISAFERHFQEAMESQ